MTDDILLIADVGGTVGGHSAPDVLAAALPAVIPAPADAATIRGNLGLKAAATRDVGAAAGTVAAGDDGRFAALAAGQATLAAGQSSGSVTYDTLAQLNTNLMPADGANGFVLSDGANTGWYVKSGAPGSGSWVFRDKNTFPAVSALAAATQQLISTATASGANNASETLLASFEGIGRRLLGMVRVDGAWVFPAVRFANSRDEVTSTPGGGIDLGPVKFELVPTTSDISIIVTGGQDRVISYFSMSKGWVSVEEAPAPVVTSTSLLHEVTDELTSVRLVIIADSIGWGLTLAANSPSTPRTGALSDPRDNLDSPSWVNLLRKFLIWLGLSTDAVISNTAPGRGEARAPLRVRPFDDPRVTRVAPYSTSAQASAAHQTVLALGAAGAMEVAFRGDQIDVVYSVRTATPGATANVYIDGTFYGTITHGDTTASWGNVFSVTVPYGAHTLRVVNQSPADAWIEDIVHRKLIVVHNQGIIATSTGPWVPSGTLLPGVFADQYDRAFVQLGTNDRTNLQQVTRSNLVAIGSYIQAKGTRLTLLAANAAPDSDASLTPARTMRDVNAEIEDAAAILGVPFVSQYSVTLQLAAEGTNFLADGLHPQEAGHSFMFRNLVAHTMDESI